MTDGQALAVEQLQEVEASAEGLLELVSVSQLPLNPQWVRVELSVSCAEIQRLPEGLPLRERERLIICIPPGFPFARPEVSTPHDRFAGFPHVQWQRYLCLYQAPSTEWDPSDGMFGFLDRLLDWLRQGAVGQLDPVGAPLHPPIAYVPTGPVRTVVPRVNAPAVSERGWFGTAHLRVVSDRRVDICGWSPLLAEETPENVGAAILLPAPLPFEFPFKVGDLLSELESRGVPRRLLILTLQAAILRNHEDDPLYVIIGTPMRGIRGGNLRQHLAAWCVDPVVAKLLRIAIHRYAAFEKLKEIGEEAERTLLDWAKDASVAWCVVREDRPEVVIRRDHDAPMAWFRDRVVSLWGCGALGGHIAEFLTRAGVRKLILRDNGMVAPGVLARQSYSDEDIGKAKAVVLAERLQRIRPDLEVEHHKKDILVEPLDRDDWTEGVDVVIDTTAAAAVMKKLELRRCSARVVPVPVVSLVIGRRAQRGLVVVAHAAHTGGPVDVCRCAKLEACNRVGMHVFVNEFWPDPPRREIFQPEPGCSDSTFVGSAADVAT